MSIWIGEREGDSYPSVLTCSGAQGAPTRARWVAFLHGRQGHSPASTRRRDRRRGRGQASPGRPLQGRGSRTAPRGLPHEQRVAVGRGVATARPAGAPGKSATSGCDSRHSTAHLRDPPRPTGPFSALTDSPVGAPSTSEFCPLPPSVPGGPHDPQDNPRGCQALQRHPQDRPRLDEARLPL